MTQHRPRIGATIASSTCLAMIYQGNAVMRSMRDLNPKLDKWKIKAATEKLADMEETYTKFLPFAPEQAGSFLSRLSTR
jgi:hypothetical protein